MTEVRDPAPFRDGIFVDTGGEVRLLGSRCRACGAQAFPRRTVCARCLSDHDGEEVRLGPTGVLYTYAVVRQAPAEFPTPYVIGYVDLDEGVRVFTQVRTDHPERLGLGQRMRAVVAPMSPAPDGHGRVSYMFQPENEE